MSTQFQYDCPHCSTRSAGFRITVTWPIKTDSSQFRNGLAICGICGLGLLFQSYDTGSGTHIDLVQNSLAYPGNRFRILDTWPDRSLSSPADVPESVGRFYAQGLENLTAQRWDAAGAMFRKSLDVATKIVSHENKSLTLFKRIEELYVKGLITEAMKDWSHEIRLDGNLAVHDEEPETPEDAASTQKFSEAFLTYMFTLPSMVAANRAKRMP